jgi:RNase P subunit RPR2
LEELAVGCEYLTGDKLCLAVSESEKAKAARQVRCENYEKMGCCYVCLFKRKCAIGCTYLGNFENEPQQIRGEKSEVARTHIKDEKSEVANSEKVPAVTCFSCNLEMCQTKTKIRIDEKETLPVIVYLCTKCGKMEFVAEEETKQKLLSKSTKA